MKALLWAVLFSISPWLMAENIEQQSLQLCEKVKLCAVAELEGHEMSADMKTMVMSSMDGMCAAMATEFSNDAIKQQADLGQQAQACMTSLSGLSCAELMDGSTNTPACTTLEKSIAAYE